MIGVARKAVADDFRVDFRTASLGMFILFEHDDASPLAHDETIAVLVVRAAGFGRAIVHTRVQGPRLREAGYAERIDGRFCTTCQHHISIVERNHPRGIADGVRAGGAGGDDGMIGAHEAVFDGNLPGDEVDQPPMNEMRADPPRAALVKNNRFAFNARQTANARTDRYARAQFEIVIHVDKTGIFQRLASCIDPIYDERIDLALYLVIHPLVGIETVFVVLGFHFAGNSAFLPGRIEPGDLPRPAFTSDKVFP